MILARDPSGIDCFIEGVLESKDWAFNAATGDWSLAEQLQTKIKHMSAKEVNEQKAQLFAYFLRGIK